MPASEEFLRLYAQYLDNRKSAEWSKNTMESARRLIRQFLVFLDDNGCRSLSETSATMLPSFFQHLLARYQPTSMQVVAFHLRAFLKFADGGERLLPLA
jgi:site-specific recombinase XerD